MLSSIQVRRTAAATGAAAAALVALAACGSSGSGAGTTAKQSPPQAAQAGFTKLADSNAETLTFKIDASSADLIALSKDDGSSKSDALTQTQADAITGGSIVLALKSSGSSFAADTKAGKGGADSVSLAVNGGGAPNLFQLVTADKVLYARADVQKFASLGGSDASQLQSFAANVPAQYAFIKDAIAGKWIKIDESQLDSLAKQGSPSGVPSVAPTQVAQIEAALQKVFTTDVTVTREAADPSLGDHLVLKGDARTVGTDLVNAFKSSLSSLPGASEAFAKADPSKIPSKVVTVDEYVKDGKLSALKLDLKQFFTAADQAAAKGPVELELDVADGASINPPSSATNVDLSNLGGLLSGLGGSGL